MKTNDISSYAAEGFDAYRTGKPKADCPYCNTSDASNAWHLGRELARCDEPRPTPDAKLKDDSRFAIMAGRGDTISIRGRCDVLLRRFRRNADNSFTPVHS